MNAKQQKATYYNTVPNAPGDNPTQPYRCGKRIQGNILNWQRGNTDHNLQWNGPRGFYFLKKIQGRGLLQGSLLSLSLKPEISPVAALTSQPENVFKGTSKKKVSFCDQMIS